MVVAVIIYAVLVVWPFKLAADWLGTNRSDWVSCFVAVLIAGALGGGASGLFGSGMGWAFFGATQGLLSLAIVAVVSGLTNMIVLGTTFLRGVMVTVIGAIAIPGTLLAAFALATRVTHS